MLDAKKYLGEMLAERYLIKREIGRGASSLVFYAEDMMTSDENGRPVVVAIKMTEREAGDAPLDKSFEKELHDVVNMPTNPHVVDIHDVSYAGREQYVVMEYVKGKTLRELIAERGGKPFSAREILSVSLQILQALRNAHDVGVIHRAVKPQNILVQSAEEAGDLEIPGGRDMPFIKLSDFGIALLPGDDLLKGKSAGTVHYVSPEQASGGAVDRRSDLYSLGVVMYEMATGRVPFDAKSAAGIMQMHRFDEPSRVRSLNPEIPLLLDQIIYAAMQKNPADRFRDAAAMERVLKEALAELSGNASSSVSAATVARRAVVIEGDSRKDAVKNAKKKTRNTRPPIRKRTLVSILCVVLVVGLLGAAFPFVLNKVSVTEMTVRNYVGKLYNENSAYDEGISVKVVKESNETIAAGTIIRQSPGGGVKVAVKKGETLELTLYVSTGPAMATFSVPESARASVSALREYLNSTYLDATGQYPNVGILDHEPLDTRDHSLPTGYVMEIYERKADGTEVKLNMDGDEVRANGYTNLVVKTNPEGTLVMPSEVKKTPAAAKTYLEEQFGSLFAVTIEQRAPVGVRFQQSSEGPMVVPNQTDLSEYQQNGLFFGDVEYTGEQVVFALLSDGTKLTLDGDAFDVYGENVPLTLVVVTYYPILS